MKRKFKLRIIQNHGGYKIQWSNTYFGSDWQYILIVSDYRGYPSYIKLNYYSHEEAEVEARRFNTLDKVKEHIVEQNTIMKKYKELKKKKDKIDKLMSSSGVVYKNIIY